MKLTKEKLYEIIEEAISLGQTKKSPYGSKEKPCPDKSVGSGLGKKLFHPQQKDVDNWECNTKIEDDVLLVMQKFISENEWVGGEQLLDYILAKFKNLTAEELPLKRVTKKVPVYRGLSFNLKKRPQLIDEVLLKMDLNNPMVKVNIEGNDFFKVPIKDFELTPFRKYTSFSYNLKRAGDFALTGEGGIIYETNTGAAGSDSMFVDFSNFYKLVDNPFYKSKSKFGDFEEVGTEFAKEQEALYLGTEPLKVNSVYINPNIMVTRIFKSDMDRKTKVKFRKFFKEKYGWVHSRRRK